MKKLVFAVLALLCLGNVFASTNACSFSSNNFVWHCSNNSPGISISPGESGQIIFYCCYTGPGLNGTENYTLNVEKLFNYTRSVQQDNGSYIIEFTDYFASDYITGIDYPETVNPNIDIPIKVNFGLPAYDENYSPTEPLKARIDVMLNTGGAFILNNAVVIRVIIPQDWEASFFLRFRQFFFENPIIMGVLLMIMIVGLLIVYFKNE